MRRLAGVGHWLLANKWWVLAAGIVLGEVIVAPSLYVRAATMGLRYATVEDAPSRPVTLVLGAGVAADGTPTPYLQRRLDTAVELYRAHKTQTLLLSGDNGAAHYNEPVAMQRYVLAQGVKAGDIVLDYAGFNTYDSCYRARAIFGVKEMIIVTHDYHLPRAIWTCRGLGLGAIGVRAQNAGRLGSDFSLNYVLREFVSTNKAVLQNVFKPRPTALGPPEPIN